MGPVLSSLVDLQAIENQVRTTQKELNKGKQQIRKQQRRIEQLQAALQAKKEEIKLTRMQRDKLELDLKSREERIANMRVALNSAKTNKEYSAVLTRINTDKANNTKLEDQILALYTQIDNDEAACKEIESETEQEGKRLESIQLEVGRHQQEIESRLAQLKQQRQEAYEKVPAKYAVLFERLAERYDGDVLSEMDQQNPPRGSYMCGGCYMKVPLESANSLMTRDNVLPCPNCGRILVLDKSPKQQPTN